MKILIRHSIAAFFIIYAILTTIGTPMSLVDGAMELRKAPMESYFGFVHVQVIDFRQSAGAGYVLNILVKE